MLFDADVQFVVNGVLDAVGTPTDSIRFLKATADEWGGLRIAGGGTSASTRRSGTSPPPSSKTVGMNSMPESYPTIKTEILS